MIGTILMTLFPSGSGKYIAAFFSVVVIVLGAYGLIVKHDQGVAQRTADQIKSEQLKDENKNLAEAKEKSDVSSKQDIQAIVDNNKAANDNTNQAQQIKSETAKKVEAAKKQPQPSVNLTNNASPVSDAKGKTELNPPVMTLSDTVSEIRINAIWESYCSGPVQDEECKGNTT